MKQIKERKITLSFLASLLVGLWLFAGCQASELTQGTVVLKVVNSITGEPVEGVVIAPDPPFEAPAAAKSGEVKKAEAAGGSSTPALTTGADGTFKKELTAGAYTLKLTRTFYKAPSPDVVISVIADREVTQTVKLAPDKPIGIEVKGGEGNFGETVEVKARIEILDGSSLSNIKWEQTGGPKANLAGADSETVTVTLPDAAAFKAALVAGLKVPDRALVQAIDPHSLDSGENISLKVTVTSSTGSNTGAGKAGAHQSFKHTLGIGNVPVGIPVLLHSKKNTGGYSWSLTTPGGSATFDNAGSQDPAFTPDMAGQYVAKENNTGATINIYAGTWAGAISSKGADGRPNADACTSCHNGSIAPDKFTPWKKSGHAEIFMNNINTYASYKETCLECHSVGYDKDIANGGIDEASDFQTFIDAKLYGNAKPTNWDTMLATYPASASASAPAHHIHPEEEMQSSRPSDKSIYWLEGEWKNEKGETMTLRSLEGKPVVWVMLYTHCEAACPILMEDVKRISKSLTEEERGAIRFVIATVDPERDTPARLSEFKKKHGAAARSWTFLQGSPALTRELEALLGIQVRKTGEQDLAHSNKITVLDSRGEIVHQSEGLRAPVAETVEAIRKLL